MADIKSLNAAQAYSNVANMVKGESSFINPPSATISDVGVDFAEMVSKSLGNSIDTQYNAEAVSAKSLVNEASLTDVSTALTNAELTLRSVVAIRDKIIQAYQEIIKMPI